MFSRIVTVLCGLTLMLWVLAPAAHGGPLSAAERRHDPRLAKRVTLLTPRVYYLGELLETLSEQAGVSLSAGDRDGAASELVLVRLKDVPLADVMNVLWSLVSYKQATWDWNSVKDAGDSTAAATPSIVRYQLTRPRAAQLLGAKLKEQVQQEFEEDAAALLEGLNKTPEEIKALEGRHKGLDTYLKSKGIRAGMETFASTLSPDVRLRVLRGQETVQIPIAQLSQQAQDFVKLRRDSLHRAYQERAFDTSHLKEPTWVKFETELLPGCIVPSLFIGIEGVGAHAYVGGTQEEKEWRQKIADLWLLEGDAADDPKADWKVAAPKKAAPEPDIRKPQSLQGILPFPRLWEVADAVPLSFVARLPTSDTGDRGPLYNLTLRDALKKMYPFQWKWRDGILVLSEPGWFVRTDDAGRVPWSIVKRLREAEAKAPNGLLPLSELAHAAHTLNVHQLQALTLDYRVMSQIAQWRDWFVLLDRQPDLLTRLQTPKGVPVREVPAVLRAKLPAEAADGKAVRVRMKVVDRFSDKQSASRRVGFEMLAADGKALAHAGFAYWSRERDTNREAVGKTP